MRHVVLSALCLTCALASPIAAQSGPSKIPSHPPEVAFVDEGPQGSVFRQTESSLRLYTFDKDSATTSRCEAGCASAWPPLYASASAMPVGDWTIVTRSDSRLQWAYRGKPVYTRFHDSPDTPTGAGIPGWHLMGHTRTPETP